MKRRLALLLRTGCLIAALASGVPAGAADLPAPGTVLTNAAQVLAMGRTNAESTRFPVRLRGISLGTSRYNPSFTLQDETDALVVYVKSAEERDQAPFGTLVEITGRTDGARLFATDTAFVRAESVRVLQTGVSPRPRRVTVEEAAAFKHYGQWVETEGVVLQTCMQEGEFVLHLAGEEGWLADRIRNWPAGNFPSNWWGARVRVQGINVGFERDPARCFGGQSINHVTILAPGHNNPFEAPLTNAAALVAARVSTPERLRLRATVVNLDDSGSLHLQANGTIVQAELLASPEQIAGPNPQILPVALAPAVWRGDVVDLVGSPQVRDGALKMRWAQVRVISSGAPPPVAGVEPEPAALTNLAQVMGLSLDEARRRPYFARLRGVITYQPPETTSWLFLQDGADGVQVFIGWNPRRFQPGQWVEVEGPVDPTTFAITIKRASVRELGVREPPPALKASPFDLQSGKHHARKVSLRGAVLDVALGEGRPVLLLSSLGVTYNAFLAERCATLPAEWMNSTIEIEGVVVSRTDLAGRASGFYLVAASNSWLRVVRPGTTNLAELPLRTARSLFEQKQITDERFRVAGVVTHVSPRGWFTIEDATGPIGMSTLVPLPIHDRRHLHIPRSGPAWPVPGDRVEAVGSLNRLRPYSPFLDYAEFRVVGRGPVPPPVVADAEEVASGQFDGRLVTVKGEVVDRETTSTGGLVMNTLWLRAGEILFRASLYSANEARPAAEPGDLVKVSGLCAFVGGDAPRGQGFTVFPPDLQAVVALGRAPGWFSPAVLQVGLASLLLMGGVLLWVRLLRRQVTARTTDLARTNVELQTEVEERKRADRVQRATYEISEAVHTTEDLNRFYRRVHEIVGSLMPAENFFLLLHDPVSGLYEYAYHVDRVDPWPKPRKVSGGLVGYILRTGRALLADHDSMTDPANEWHSVSGTPSAVWLGVPLMARGQAIGVMAVQDYENPRAYGEEEKQILTYVAEQTALMIERKRADAAIAQSEARLRQSEQLFRTAFRSNPAVMALTRLEDGKFLAANDAFLKVAGYTEAEVIGQLAKDLNLYADPAQRLEFVGQLKRNGCVFNRELQMRTKGGGLATMLVSGEVIDINGEPHTLTVGLDITDRKKAEQDILRALDAERELGELKSRFVSMVSHEFRTPLGITMSAIELLRNHLELLDEAKRKELFDDIFSSTRHMAGLMEQVLLLGRVEAGKLGFRPAPLDLETVCLKLVDESLSATNRHCPIETKIEGALREARADESLLRHIFSNLLSNAVKYSPAGTPVEFAISRDGEWAVFRVCDRGIGIPEADLPKLFQAFHRAANVGETPGTGLGLVIVKRCVELHGGSIEVQSKPGEGTSFSVRLPVWASPAS